MRLSFPTTLSLTASLASVAAAANMNITGSSGGGGGILEVDVMFPRNDTYTWKDELPVVFAIQNSALATNLRLEIGFEIFDLLTDPSLSHPIRNGASSWRPFNVSASEPNYMATFFSPIEFGNVSSGRWRLSWFVAWRSCDELASSATGGGFQFTEFVYSRRYVDFTIQPGAQPIDMVAATADGTPCPKEYGVAINVTSPSVVVPPAASGSAGNYTCAAVNTESPKATPNPCRVKVDSSVVASFSASRTAEMCSARPGHCGMGSGSQPLAEPLAVASVVGLGAMVGVLGFILV